jgi:YidC/Oxa1 family membrane protein insertase
MLQPQIDEIKNNYSGEEANDRIMKLYKDKNINPFYSIKSLFGFLIQIPLFIAVFDVLGESIYLLGESFVFINDLSKPDQWATLPIFIPFFGSSLNLLPLCMMIISLLSAYLYSDRNLNKNLLDNQKRKLYLMSVLFFVLLFTFPSGMVLYWTTSNFLQLMQTQIKKALQ